MSLKNNYHTHLKLCNHAVGMTEDYVKAAISINMDELGMTDHAPIPNYFMTQSEHENNWTDENMSEKDFYDIYIPDVKSAKEKYKNEIKVFLGLESEYLKKHHEYYKKLRESLDYMIVGIHFFQSAEKVLNSYADLTYKTIYDYANNAIDAISSGLFKILAHPDLFMFNYKDENGNRNFDENCEKVARMIIEKAIEKNVYLEMNVNGIRNSEKYGNGARWLYPDYNFWKIASEYKNLKVIVSGDCHDPKHLCAKENDDVLKMASDLGIEIKTKIDLWPTYGGHFILFTI